MYIVILEIEYGSFRMFPMLPGFIEEFNYPAALDALPVEPGGHANSLLHDLGHVLVS